MEPISQNRSINVDTIFSMFKFQGWLLGNHIYVYLVCYLDICVWLLGGNLAVRGLSQFYELICGLGHLL